MSTTRLWLLILITLAGSLLAPAQTNVNEEQGLKPYDAWHGGDLDSISMTSGGLSLHIPLVSFPQRGNLDLSFSVYASSKQWRTRINSLQCNNPNDPNGCTPYWIPIVRGIEQPQFGTPAVEGAYVTSSLDWVPDNECNVQPGNENNGYTVEYDWIAGITAPDGSIHSFGGGMSINGTGCPNPPYRALDASGILQSNATTIIMPNGTHFNFPVNGNPSFVDANGNTITLNSNVYSDTLGRIVPLPPFASTTDVTNCPAGSVASRVWTVPGYAGGTRTFKLCYSNVSIYTTFGSGGNEYGPANNVLLTAIVLPDLTAWTFSYDHWGDITRVGFPTGGSISYTYAISPITCGDDTPMSMVVTSRTVDANDGTGGHTWTYSYAPPTMVVTDPSGNDTVHTIVDPTTGQIGCTLVDTQVQHYQGSRNGGTLLKTVSTQYSFTLNTLSAPGSGASAINVVPHQITTTLKDGNSSKIINTWDNTVTESPYGTAVPIVLGSLLQKDEYDFSNTLVRSTVNRYLWQDNPPYLPINFVHLKSSVTVKDGAGNQLAQTGYGYDDVNRIFAYGNTVGQGPAPAGSARGNLNYINRWLNTTNSMITAITNVYDTGQAYQAIDPLGHTTTFSYSTSFFGAYPTQVNLPDTQMPDAGAPIVHHIISGNYDFNTGLLTRFADQNGQQYTYTYDSLMLRLSQGNHPDGGITKFFYPDPNTVERQRLITGTTYDDYKVKFDGLGRPYQIQQTTPAGIALTDSTYDTLGRVSTVSNPYYQGSSHGADPTYGITQFQYDALSRATRTVKTDGSFSTITYEDSAGDTSGAPLTCTTRTDETGKKRQTCIDAFGRLAKVIEPNPGAVATNATGWVTVSGSEQSANSQPGAAASVTVTIGGADSTNTITTCLLRCIISHPKDTGSMSFTVVAGGVTIGPVAVSGGYNGNSTPAGLAAALYSAFPANSSVTMSNPNGTATFTLTAASVGSAGNSYAITTSMTSNCVPNSTDTTLTTCAGVGWTMTLSGPNLAPTTASSANFTGGQNVSSTPDTGSVTITVNGTNYSTTYASADTSSTIAARLATAINAGAYAHAAASGGTINLTSQTPGTAGDYLLSASYTWNSAQFTNPSFTTSVSGAAFSGALDASGLNNHAFVTTYQYNARNDLLCVHQKATDTTADSACNSSTPPSVPASWRQRFFTYDSFSRLLTAMNPELNSTGSTKIAYTYDNAGNVTSKNEPAPNQGWGSAATVTINYTYDALNRLLDTTYTDGTTPKASARYDYSAFQGKTMGYPIGRPVASMTLDGANNILTANFLSYDPTGRVAATVQCNTGVAGCNTFTATYDQLGNLTRLAYPGNSFAVTYTYDSAARLYDATDSNGVNYAHLDPTSQLTLLASGAMQEFTAPNFANNKYHVDFNNRLQPVEMWTGNTKATALFDKQYSYNAPGTSQMNNGNIFTVTNVRDDTRTQSFTYDALDRLLSAGDKTHWSNTYTYDAWGNLTNKTPGAPAGENMNKAADTNNHLSGLNYDAAGNVQNDGGNRYSYDAENRVICTNPDVNWICNANSVIYTYDASGRRIKKSTGTNYWYGPGGQVFAESDATGAWTNYIYFAGQRLARNVPQPVPNPADIKYYITDHLRSTAMFVDKAGNQAAILDDNDFYPWGGVVPGVGKTTSNNTIKFTGQYRDAESNLDYFGARYYSNAIGRFLSPDWDGNPTSVPYATFSDPQSLNLYSYVRNSPIVRTDGTGHFDDPFNTFNTTTELYEKEHQSDDGEGDDGSEQQQNSNQQASNAQNNNSQDKQKKLTKDELEKIVEDAKKQGKDPITTMMTVLNNLGNNVTVSGNDLRDVFKDQGIQIPASLQPLIDSTQSLAKSGNTITVTTNHHGEELNVGGNAIKIDQVVKFDIKGNSISNMSGLKGQGEVNLGFRKVHVWADVQGMTYTSKGKDKDGRWIGTMAVETSKMNVKQKCVEMECQ